jgi:sterol 3beta-glucosyltransferase
MTHVMIIAVGSRGDVAPYTGVGVRLRAAGHDVTVAADKGFEEMITTLGLDFRPVIGDMRAAADKELHQDSARDGVFSRSTVKLLKQAKQFFADLNRNVADLCAEGDVLLLCPLASAGYHVAQARGVPSIGVHLQAQQPTREFPPMVFGRSLGGWGNRLAGKLIGRAERMYFSNVNEIRDEHGLPPTTFAAVRREQAEENWPILHGISRHVLPRPRDWRPGLEIAGYWWPASPPGWAPPVELREFLEAGAPPVFVGFGSANPGDVARLSQLVTTALRETGQRGVIQAGWANLSSTDDDMLTIGDVPHEWLFPRMAAVVHAAGAGTTAAGLRAGVPAVPIPITGDGPFWSYRMTTLGVTPGPIPFKKLTAERLAGAVREAVTNPVYRERAEGVAEAIGAEDGATRVLETVEALR